MKDNSVVTRVIYSDWWNLIADDYNNNNNTVWNIQPGVYATMNCLMPLIYAFALISYPVIHAFSQLLQNQFRMAGSILWRVCRGDVGLEHSRFTSAMLS